MPVAPAQARSPPGFVTLISCLTAYMPVRIRRAGGSSLAAQAAHSPGWEAAFVLPSPLTERENRCPQQPMTSSGMRTTCSRRVCVGRTLMPRPTASNACPPLRLPRSRYTTPIYAIHRANCTTARKTKPCVSATGSSSGVRPRRREHGRERMGISYDHRRPVPYLPH